MVTTLSFQDENTGSNPVSGAKSECLVIKEKTMENEILDVEMVPDEFGDFTGCCPKCKEIFYFPLFFKGKSYPCRNCGQEIWVNKE